jgi:hypothetical protein
MFEIRRFSRCRRVVLVLVRHCAALFSIWPGVSAVVVLERNTHHRIANDCGMLLFHRANARVGAVHKSILAVLAGFLKVFGSAHSKHTPFQVQK